MLGVFLISATTLALFSIDVMLGESSGGVFRRPKSAGADTIRCDGVVRRTGSDTPRTPRCVFCFRIADIFLLLSLERCAASRFPKC